MEAEAFTSDAFSLLDSATRLDVSKNIKDKQYDLDILQAKEILHLEFKHEDTKHDRADNLCNLVKHIASNFSKIIKITGFLMQSDDAFGKLDDKLSGIVETLSNSGIDTSASLLNRIDALEFNANTAGVSSDNQMNVTDNLSQLLENCKKP